MRALTVTACGLAAAASVLLLHLAWGPPSPSVPPRGLELSGLTIVDPGKARLPKRTVRVEGGTIAEVSTTVTPTASSAYAGTYALPGLVDLHVHHPPVVAWGERELFALLFLRHGVTSVRDVGSFGGGMLEHRRRVQEGDLPGPRVYACGPIVDGFFLRERTKGKEKGEEKKERIKLNCCVILPILPLVSYPW